MLIIQPPNPLELVLSQALIEWNFRSSGLDGGPYSMREATDWEEIQTIIYLDSTGIAYTWFCFCFSGFPQEKMKVSWVGMDFEKCSHEIGALQTSWLNGAFRKQEFETMELWQGKIIFNL